VRTVPGFRYVIVDVFTSEPLTGNQLAVFTDARAIPEERLQRLAKEMNFSESAFVYPPEGEGHVKVRIFTTSTEVPFAGHPCLGTAFVMAAPLQLVDVVLETGNGLVPVHLEREGPRIVFGRMEQPLPTISEFDGADELQEVLGVTARLPIELYDNGIQHVFVVLGSEDEVAALKPNFTELEDFGPLAISCCAGSELRWKNRMFFPGLGGTEDPATGSAAGPLALHLARHGRSAFGDEIEIHQGVEIGRHSTLFARVEGSADVVERIEVGGSAVVVARGEFHV
jgi:trans-2,3-dihydro-3-hydroxyanthranilate isomerase